MDVWTIQLARFFIATVQPKGRWKLKKKKEREKKKEKQKLSAHLTIPFFVRHKYI